MSSVVMSSSSALSRFISRLSDRGLPFFKLLRKSDKFEWNEEAAVAFQQLKEFLTSPPVLSAPEDEETLLLYIAATTHVVSTALVVERDEPGHVYKVQRPIYFISEVLGESKARYPQVQKLLYAILITSRNFGTTSRPTRLRRPYPTHSATSCTTRMPIAESSNGQ